MSIWSFLAEWSVADSFPRSQTVSASGEARRIDLTGVP
jgi:hypothetical protein